MVILHSLEAAALRHWAPTTSIVFMVLACWNGPLVVRVQGFRGHSATDSATSSLSSSAMDQLSLELEEDPEAIPERPLFGLTVEPDLESLDVKEGLTVLFDRHSQALTVTAGKKPEEGLAWGHYDDQIATTGWSELRLTTAPSTSSHSGDDSVSGDVKMYAAGVLEGLLTSERMSQFHANSHELVMKDEENHHSLLNIQTQFGDSVTYLKRMANLVDRLATKAPDDPYWQHGRYLLFQLWGIRDGYNCAAEHFGVHKLSLVDLMLLNSDGEVPELMEAYEPRAMAARGKAALVQKFAQQPSQSHIRKVRPHRTGAIPPLVSPAGGLAFLELNSSRAASAPAATAATTMLRRSGRGAAQANQATKKSSSEADGGDVLDDKHWEQRIARDGRCSALVRLSEGNEDLLVGHTTWADYSEMTRVWKFYEFDLPHATANRISMSSYPGCISSTDDFYLMDSGLLAMETTLEILDPKAREKVEDFPATPHLPAFMHTMILNRLSPSALAWANLHKTNNPGTYNSQWMVVDYNKFVEGQPPPDGTFFVVESVPGLVEERDMTPALREKGFWASFNRPYFDAVREESGHSEAQRTHGELYSYDGSPRGRIFAENVPGVGSLVGMRSMMTHNAYGAASSSAGGGFGGPGHEISARMDLSPDMPIPNGGIDAKVTNRCLFRSLMAQTISGPSHASQAAFRWTNADGNDRFPGWPHQGLPDVWNFDWIQMTPESPMAALTDPTAC